VRSSRLLTRAGGLSAILLVTSVFLDRPLPLKPCCFRGLVVLSGTFEGNSLMMQFNSSTGGIDCVLSARVSADRNTVDAIYKCDSADPARVVHASALLKR